MKFFTLSVLCTLLGVTLLFPKEILLRGIAWKAASYCREAFGAMLSYDALVWEGGKIVFKNGKLLKKEELYATFSEARLSPFLDWKKRLFGGALQLQQLKIVHRKKELRSVPTPPPPSSKWMTLQLDTQIEQGELFLYDYLAKHHFFQHARFDLTHHILGQQTCGSISFDWEPGTPQFVTHFQTNSQQRLDLTAHFHSHSFPVLSHLVAYFFQSYVPEPAFKWDIVKGSVDGNLEMSIKQGVPLIMKGKIDLIGVQGENPPLAISAECDSLRCDLDFDFSCLNTINGQFDLKGGKLSLKEKGDFWNGMWNLKEVHSTLSIKEGKVDRSCLKGNLMGMEGSVVLDWHAPEALMKMEFVGLSKEIFPFLPLNFQPGFQVAFPEDQFTLNASLKRSGEGLELAGSLGVTDHQENFYQLFFGCLMGKGENPFEIKRVVTPISCISPVDSFIERLKQQFCLSQKRVGWFSGSHFPLQKFLSPFLLRHLQMRGTGFADFEGTFDERYLMLVYEGEDFCLDAPHFNLFAEVIKEKSPSDRTAVHYVDLKTGDHAGFLPLKKAVYTQKNYGFCLEKADALVHFENNKIHILNIEATGEGLEFEGEVDLAIRSLEDIDMTIDASKITGEAAKAQKFLAHFKPSFFWQIPIQGEVIADHHPLFFRYHFAPTASLIEGKIQGNVYLTSSSLFLDRSPQPLLAEVSYDCLTSQLVCTITKEAKPYLSFRASSQTHGEEKEINVMGTKTGSEGNIRLEALQSGKELCVRAFEFGDWQGKADVVFQENVVCISQLQLWSTQNTRFCFSGIYNISQELLQGQIQELKWDFTSFFQKSSLTWKPKGEIVGSGPFAWKIKQGICSVDGLQVEIPGEEKTYKLGRFHYDNSKQALHFEGFDFSIPPEKLPRATEMVHALFPEKIPLSLMEKVKTLRPQEALEGHLSLEVNPDTVWFHLCLNDGLYCVLDKPLELKNFHLSYAPLELNLWTQVLFRDHYYGVHVVTDTATMSEGRLALSEHDLYLEPQEEKKVLVALWEREKEQGWNLKKVKGTFCGMDVALEGEKKLGRLSLQGNIAFDPFKIAPLLRPSWKKSIEQLALTGGWNIKGEFSCLPQNLSEITFTGYVSGEECQVAGVCFAAFSSHCSYKPDEVKISDFAIKDVAGTLTVDELLLNRKESFWHLQMDKLSLAEMRLSKLKSPWTQSHTGDKPLFPTLVIRSCILEDVAGNLGDFKSFSGSGKVEFTNLPKRTLLSNILFLPSEISARIGLDFTNMMPVRGTIEYLIRDGKVNFTEFKEMYSDTRHSRFYLAEGFPAYIDFKGNLNMKVKMKQYSLLMKLTELFTITVKGTLLHPTYTLSNSED